MEKENDKSLCKRNCIPKLSSERPLTWHVNITSIDLSLKNIDIFHDSIQFPDNLLHLNLSHNKFTDVPVAVLKLGKLKSLHLSYNAIEQFDEAPNFCHTLERLDLAVNQLHRPPYWIWTEKPKQLSWVNISCNPKINVSVQSYIDVLLQYDTLVSDIDLHNCGFKNAQILETFPHAKTIILGNGDFNYSGANVIGSVPCKSLEKCCNVERLNLSNTHIHSINHSIDIFKYLCDLNLAFNNIHGIPNEFCNLHNLETCVLSFNKLLFLPDAMYKLKKLQRLYLNSNELCMLPERLKLLPNLKMLDLYDNQLHEIEDFSHLEEFDVAQNYLNEPEGVDYLAKKGKLRCLHEHRSDGRKPEPKVVQPDTEHSSESDDEEEYYKVICNDGIPAEESSKPENNRSSSPEIWDSDSDDHWIPHDIKFTPKTETWIHNIKRKMQEGNFCPVDAHVVPVTEQVMQLKRLYPQADVEVAGQFDDYSSDDS